MDGTSLASDPHISTQPSIYHELPLRNQFHIRILSLAPGEQTDPLRGVVFVENLKGGRPPRYAALSYVWGAPERTHALECNEREILITETLDRALRHLRGRNQELWLWIDQICIDQDNLGERTHQLHIMKQIYLRAWKVISWLGPDTEHQAPLARDLIMRIPQVDGNGPETVHFPTNQQLKMLGLPPRESASWVALQQLLQHKYFERVWVLQEVRMGCNVWLHWGETEIRWSHVSSAYIFATKFWMHIADPQTSMRPCPTLSLERLEAFLMSSTSWIDLLRATRRFGATDARDKVFALIGLTDEETVLGSDYAASLGQTYANAVKHIIRTSGDLRILAYVWIRDLRALEGVPSWAPRWDDIADLNKTPKVLADWASYSASGPEKVRLRDDGEWGVLTLEGVIVDAVDCLAPPLDSWDNLEATWWKVVAESLRIADPAGRLQDASPEYLIVPFLWTITAGQSLGANGLTCPATEPQHIEDFVAFAFNGILQSLSSNAGLVCLREILNVVDCALRSLPETPALDERVYDEYEREVTLAGHSPEPAQFQDEQDENLRPFYVKSDLEDSLEGDLLSGAESETGVVDEEEIHIHRDSEEDENAIGGNPFTILPGRPRDDGGGERRPGTPDKSVNKDSFRKKSQDNLQGGNGNNPEDMRQHKNQGHGDQPERNLVDENPSTKSDDDLHENRHPLGVIHQDDRAQPGDDGSHAPPMSHKWIEKTLRSFHPSDPATVDAAIDVFVRAHAKHDTAAVIRFMSQFEVSSVNRRFFVTKKGYMGIGPTYMQQGDIVCVLFGGPTPYVLRPTSEGEYLFLGECYVDDVMNGEALTLLDKGRRETQWFRLR